MPFDLTFSNFSFAHTGPGNGCAVGGDYHAGYEMIFLPDGADEFITETKKFLPQKGDVLFIPPGTHHLVTAKQGLDAYIVRFSEQNIPAEMLPLGKSAGCYAAKSPVLAGLFFGLGSHVCHYQGAAAEKLFGSLLCQIIFYFCSDAVLREYQTCNEKICGIMSYIRNHFTSSFTLDGLCQAVGCSESFACKVFQHSMGIPIIRYVNMKRVLLAESLIIRGNKPMDIFEQCGFNDYSTFYRSYKKVFGRTPSVKAL